MRAALEKKKNAAVRVRRMAKGEASAKTRSRRDNKHHVLGELKLANRE